MLSEGLTTIAEELTATAIVSVQTVNYNGFGPANASGNLARNITYIPNQWGLFDIVAVDSAAAYVGTLRYGRKAGGSFPSSLILNWMDEKKLFMEQTENKRKSIAFLITRKIVQSGNYINRNNLAPTNIWDELLAEAQGKIGNAISSDFITIWL